MGENLQPVAVGALGTWRQERAVCRASVMSTQVGQRSKGSIERYEKDGMEVLGVVLGGVAVVNRLLR